MSLDVGLASLDTEGRWIGGRYYLQHLVRASAMHPQPGVRIHDIYWEMLPETDPFAEVRDMLDSRKILSMPASLWKRFGRMLRKGLKRSADAGDLFERAGIDVVFPIPLIESHGIAFVFWLSDLQFLVAPERYESSLGARMKAETEDLMRRADLVIVSSDDSLEHVRRYYPDEVNRCRVLHFPSVPDESWWKLDPKISANDLSLPEKFFFVSNQFTEHKNHGLLLRALEKALKQRPEIVIVASGSDYDFRGRRYIETVREEIERRKLAESFRIVGFLDRSLQIALLRRSVAVLQPSLFEGWSTVVEDAKSLGKSILLSDIAVHREQMIDAASRSWLLDPGSEHYWAEAMIAASDLPPGPAANEEKAGAERMSIAAETCAREFADCMRNAVTRFKETKRNGRRD